MPVPALIIRKPPRVTHSALLLHLHDAELATLRTAAQAAGVPTDEFILLACAAEVRAAGGRWPHRPSGPCSKCGNETQETVWSPKRYLCFDCQDRIARGLCYICGQRPRLYQSEFCQSCEPA